MSVYRRPNQNNYFSSNRTWMQDYRLSCKAVGLLARMLSMPADWEFHQSQLAKKLTEGEDAIRAYMMELVKYGYLLKLPRNRDGEGRWGDVTYEVWDVPQFKEPLSDKDVEKIFTASYTTKEFKSIYGRDLPNPENPGWADPDQANPRLQIKQEPQVEQKKQQQHSAAASLSTPKKEKQAPEGVGFFPIYQSLKPIDIPIPDKEEITRMYTEAQVASAVAWATHPTTKVSQSLQQAIKWACKHQPEIPRDPVDISQENETYAKQLKQTANVPKGAYFEVLSNRVELGYTTGTVIPVEISFFGKNFKEALTRAFATFRIVV